jgi:16S rRNA (guanine966-N2)-methyltransferase
MRIIAGHLGGRRFDPPSKMPNTRPTTDIAKEGLFNVLQHRLDIPEMKTLDLFGGTGNISYELASRGATDLTVVEKDQSMVEFIKNTSSRLGIENLHVVKMEVFSFIERCQEKFDFIFAGPPYAMTTINDLPKRIFEYKLLKEEGWFVLEHTPRNNYESFPFFQEERNYGTTVFSVFVNK